MLNNFTENHKLEDKILARSTLKGAEIGGRIYEIINPFASKNKYDGDRKIYAAIVAGGVVTAAALLPGYLAVKAYRKLRE